VQSNIFQLVQQTKLQARGSQVQLQHQPLHPTPICGTHTALLTPPKQHNTASAQNISASQASSLNMWQEHGSIIPGSFATSDMGISYVMKGLSCTAKVLCGTCS
jgi:hypothetical protein